MSTYPDDKARCSEAKQLSWTRSAALERMGGDEKLLDEVVALFLVESPKLVTQMQQALLHHDRHMLELAAHCLRGQLGYLELPEASEAQKLEDAGRTGELQGAEDSLAALKIRLAGVWSILGENPAV